MTHLIYLNNSEIYVDAPSIEEMGIQCIMVDGTVLSDGKPAFDSDVLDIAMKEITNASSFS
jgi:hypothetical protein